MPQTPVKGPALFIGHGSPMNALARNDFTAALRHWSEHHPKPEAILSISAHWMSRGTFVSCQPNPRQIFDFFGFPDELYRVSYACPGNPSLANQIMAVLTQTFQAWTQQHAAWSAREFGCSEAWGIDHGTWTVLKHLYPAADIPVVQLSLDMSQPPEYHYRLGEALRALRRNPVLILGSGNLVHNLSLIEWEEDAPVTDWALSMDDSLKKLLKTRDVAGLLNYPHQGLHGRRGIPTLDHYLPMLYILGLMEKEESVNFIFEGMQNATISMRSFELV